MYRLARRYGANHCFHVTRSMVFSIILNWVSFDTSLHQRRDMRLWQGPARCVRVAQENLDRDGRLWQRHFAMIPPLRTYLFDTGAVPRHSSHLFPSPTVIDTFRRLGSGEHFAGGSYSGGKGSVLGMN